MGRGFKAVQAFDIESHGLQAMVGLSPQKPCTTAQASTLRSRGPLKAGPGRQTTTCGVEHSLLIPPVSRLILPHQQSKVCVIAYRSSTPIMFTLQGSLWGNQIQKRSLPSDSPDSLWPCPASLLVLLVYSYSSMSYVPLGPL